jgi:uncharacterized protein (DUF1501 family)
MDRRLFIKQTALAGLAFSSMSKFLLSASAAASKRGKKQFVFVFLRGAADGLNICAPCFEPDYYRLRPNIALLPPGKAQGNRAAALRLDDSWGLHPALAPLLPLYQNKQLAIVHAVGSPDATRSHFDAQDTLSLGTPGRRATESGFLSRQMQGAAAAAPLAAVAFGPQTPACLRGYSGAITVNSLDALVDRKPGAGAAQSAMEKMYAGQPGDPAMAGGGKGEYGFGGGADALLAVSASAGGKAVAELKRVTEKIPPGEGYPRQAPGSSFQQLAQLIKADVGLEVASLDIGGWDHHSAEPARMNGGLTQLARSLRAFHDDLGPRMADVGVIVMTEFGRMVKENGAAGTDHGHGSLAFALGGAVRGGHVYGRWPGLNEADLFEGRDLKVTTDFRAVLSEGLEAQLGAKPETIFPGFARPEKLDLFG